MAVIKCKMCGGDLELVPDATVCECEYCGTRQTVPAADDEKKLKLFERANRLRRACEFDKAAGVYESIVADFDTESEAYWGLVLCKFGIEYVDDPATGKKVPTCHRAGFESVEDDANFEQACENADAVARRVYRAEGRAIDELRERILEVSGKEEPYDIFISYKELADGGERTEDSVLAQDVYDALTAKGYRVFFSRVTLEDKLGVEYEPYIFAALNSAKVMLLVGMDYENLNAVWVKNEWSRYLALMAQNKEKVLIPCYKDMDPYDLPKEVRKLAAQDMGKVGAMQDLLRGVEKIIPLKTAEPVAAPQPVVMSGGPNVTALQKRGVMALEDAQWDAAKSFFDQVLNMDAENAEAWLGLAMADMKLQHESMFSALQNGQAQADGNASYRRFLRFAPPERVQQIQGRLEVAERTKQERDAAAALKAAEEAEKRRQQAAAAAERRRQIEAEEEKERERKLDAQRRHLEELAACRARIAPAQGLIAAGGLHTAALMIDGTVRSTKYSTSLLDKGSNQWMVSDWKDVIQIAAGAYHTLGLKADGTVLATPFREDSTRKYQGQCAVKNWKNIKKITAGFQCSFGIRDDGTCVAAGENKMKQLDVQEWTDMEVVSCGHTHTVGIKTDGSLVAAGYNKFGQLDVDAWKSYPRVVSVACGQFHTVALFENGQVRAIGVNNKGQYDYGQCNVSGWEDIVAIAACRSGYHTVGLRADGTVVAVGKNDSGQCNVQDWTDIVAIDTGDFHTVGLRADGTVVATAFGSKGINMGQCTIPPDWKLFNSVDTIEEERIAARERRKAGLRAEQKALEEELSTLKGLFSGSRRAQIEARLAEIASELKMLGAE